MKVLYIADDGTEFEDKDECQEYERLQNANVSKLLSEIHAFTEKGDEIKVGDGLGEYNIDEMLMETMYVTFDSNKARDFFDEQQAYYGYEQIGAYIDSCKDGDVYLYNEDVEEWESAMEMIERYQEILDKFKERQTT